LGSIRVLLAGPPAQDREVDQALAGADGITLVGAATDPVELLLACGRSRADVVVMGMDEDTLPGVATHLLAEYPHVKLLGITRVTRRVLLYELHPRLVSLGRLPRRALPDMILDMIRAAVRAEVPE
jgi:DNA-binding NarL/FixJ family response regulator